MSLTLMGHSATQAGTLLEFLGRMLGKALYEGILLDLPLAGFFLKKFRTQHCDVRTLPSHASPACSLVSPWVQRSCHTTRHAVNRHWLLLSLTAHQFRVICTQGLSGATVFFGFVAQHATATVGKTDG